MKCFVGNMYPIKYAAIKFFYLDSKIHIHELIFAHAMLT